MTGIKIKIMGKTLGLDLGTNSIGWAVVDEENKQIMGTGVRIFPEGVVKESIGKGDKEESKNASRRADRQKRRGFYRHRLRRIKLLEALIDLKMCPLSIELLNNWKHYNKKLGQAGKQFPNSPEFIEWLKLNPYLLRRKALNEDVNLQEFGRILYHIIQRRGFLSNRKGKDDGKIFKGKDDVIGIDETKNQIKESTLGDFFATILPIENEPYKTMIDENGKELRVRSRYTLRDMYIKEFELIWQKQAEQLGLHNKLKEIKRERFISGSIFSKRNKNKIEKLQQLKGKENIQIKGNKISITEQISLKEFFGGKIDVSEDDTLKYKSNDSVLFFQRPLRSQKGLLAKCSIEGREFFDKKNNRKRIVGPTPCPISHPEYEEFRALQFINNIEYGTKQKLDINQRRIVMGLFNKKEAAFDFELIPKELKLTYEMFNYTDEAKVAGNYTTTKLSKLFDSDIFEKHKAEIWHCFYFFVDNDKLIEKLAKDYGLKKGDYEKIKNINLKEGYSSVSLKAIRNITPFLWKGYRYSDAVLLGGVRNAFKTPEYDRWDNFKEEHEKIERDVIAINREKSNKEGEAIEKIKVYLIKQYGFEENDKQFKKLYHHSQDTEQKNINTKLDKIENLRNPIVQQGLNELRRLVNELIKEQGKFDKIKVELGRDLKISKSKRQEIYIKNTENNKENELAREKLSEYGLARSRENIQKYLLWKELEEKSGIARCPYTGKTISISELLGDKNIFQIEHIIPKSTSLDDSFANKTLCESKFNGLKGNKTPYQFYQENKEPNLWGGMKSWNEVKDRAYRTLPYKKAKRFTTEKVDDDMTGFIERQLNDTRYMSKKAKEILTQICPKERVYVMPGSVTSELRHLWGLNTILEPFETLDFKGVEINPEKTENYHVVFDKNDQAVSYHPINNKKPGLGKNETTLPGFLNKKGEFTSKYYTGKTLHEDLKGEIFEGQYWKKLELSEKPLQIVSIFTPKPQTETNTIVIRGKINKKIFENETIGKRIKAEQPDGTYYAKFKVKQVKFEKPQIKTEPKKNPGQVLLYGNIENGVFKSYIYECQTGEGDGKYWGIIDLDMEQPEFINTMNPRPQTDEHTILIQGSVNEKGIFSSDIDKEHQFQTELPQGKYWAVFEVKKEQSELYPFKNMVPQIDKEQKLLEGSIWLDKYTGEIKFDPKKNRDDHRHHAIDAITIALTEQSYIQKLSTYNALMDDKKRGIGEKPTFDAPWESFYKDVKQAAEGIIVSHKANRKVLTKINKTVHKNGGIFNSIGYAASGQLHKENVYGKRQSPDSEQPYFHIRKSVESLKDEKQVKKIADPIVRGIILRAKEEEKKIRTEIEELNKQSKRTKTEEEDLEIKKQIDQKLQEIKLFYTLPNKNGEPVPIKKVRIKENLGNMVNLKERKIYAEKKNEMTGLNQHVNPRNNHHVAIYENSEGQLFEKIVTFWEAVERKKAGLPVIDKQPGDGSRFISSLEINDMFIIGLKDEEINWDDVSQKELSKHLFRVQKLSSMYYTFRHHLASTLDNQEQEYRIVSFKTWNEVNPIKVKISITGRVLKE